MMNIKFNASDQHLAVKEGGLVDKNQRKTNELLEKIVDNMGGRNGKPVKISIGDGREFQGAVVGALNGLA
jgi:hypothetical protein